jgi:hypothetical protein
MSDFILTAHAVKEYRAKHECSMQEAQRAVLQDALRAALDEAQSVDDLKRIIRFFINKLS